MKFTKKMLIQKLFYSHKLNSSEKNEKTMYTVNKTMNSQMWILSTLTILSTNFHSALCYNRLTTAWYKPTNVG